MTSFKDIIRSASTRFLPGWVVMMTVVLFVFTRDRIDSREPREWILLGIFTVIALLGHVAALALMRKRLRDDANVVSSKSVIAGGASVGAIIINSYVSTSGRGIALIIATYFLLAALLTTATYLPWIKTASAAPEREPDRV